MQGLQAVWLVLILSTAAVPSRAVSGAEYIRETRAADLAETKAWYKRQSDWLVGEIPASDQQKRSELNYIPGLDPSVQANAQALVQRHFETRRKFLVEWGEKFTAEFNQRTAYLLKFVAEGLTGTTLGDARNAVSYMIHNESYRRERFNKEFEEAWETEFHRGITRFVSLKHYKEPALGSFPQIAQYEGKDLFYSFTVGGRERTYSEKGEVSAAYKKLFQEIPDPAIGLDEAGKLYYKGKPLVFTFYWQEVRHTKIHQSDGTVRDGAAYTVNIPVSESVSKEVPVSPAKQYQEKLLVRAREVLLRRRLMQLLGGKS